MTGAERAASIVAVVAFAMSATALYEYARDVAGFTAVTAAGMPIIIDALVLVAGQISLDRHSDGHRSGLAGVVFWSAIAVSVAANYAHAVPAITPTGVAEAVGGCFAALPPLALAGSYELVVRERRRRANANDPVDVTALDTAKDIRSSSELIGTSGGAITATVGNGHRPVPPDGDQPARPAADRGRVDMPEVVAAYLAGETGRSIHDGQLTAVVATELGVSTRTARRRLRKLREAHTSADTDTYANVDSASSADVARVRS